nr:hypothetical protein [Tanacetum cinerariifolium]
AAQAAVQARRGDVGRVRGHLPQRPQAAAQENEAEQGGEGEGQRHGQVDALAELAEHRQLLDHDVRGRELHRVPGGGGLHAGS